MFKTPPKIRVRERAFIAISACMLAMYFAGTEEGELWGLGIFFLGLLMLELTH